MVFLLSEATARFRHRRLALEVSASPIAALHKKEDRPGAPMVQAKKWCGAQFFCWAQFLFYNRRLSVQSTILRELLFRSCVALRAS
jgi:hypothetical protein